MSDRLPPDEENPWRTRSRQRIYQNPWMQVEEHQVIRPDGDDGIYGVVHPTRLALGIVPLEDDGRVWLVGQYRYTLDRYSWEIPEGGGDPQRDPLEEAARELKEETGLAAEHWSHLLTLHTSNCFTSERAEVYLARGLQQGVAEPEGSERLQLACIPLREALAAIRDGRITDAISVAALLALRE